MATVVEKRLVDDLDQGPADETVAFALDGKKYMIDLSTVHAKALRENLQEYIEAARPDADQLTSTSRRPAPARRSPQRKQELAEIREWARAHGHEVSDRGRISHRVREEYQAANG